MKTILSMLLVTFLSGMVSAQMTVLPEPTKAQRDQAKEIVLQLDELLSLTEKQELLVENKQLEFILKKESIIQNNKSNKEESNAALLALYKEQKNEFADILTRPQLQRYEQIRDKIDPMIVVVDK